MTEIHTPQVPGQFDPRTPRTSHDGLAAAMYANTLRHADGPILNVAAGHTDLQRDLGNLHIQKPVVALDPDYETFDVRDPRREHPERWVAGVVQETPYEANTFAATVCQFGIQHIPQTEFGAALREMVRVTKPAASGRDASKGIIFINPVFDPKRLEAALEDLGFGDDGVVGITRHDTNDFAMANRKDIFPTLWLHKLPGRDGLTPQKLEAVIAAVTQTGALWTRRTLGEVAARAFRGQSYV